MYKNTKGNFLYFVGETYYFQYDPYAMGKLFCATLPEFVEWKSNMIETIWEINTRVQNQHIINSFYNSPFHVRDVLTDQDRESWGQVAKEARRLTQDYQTQQDWNIWDV